MFACKTSGLYYKSFRILIYDRNESTMVIYNRNDSGQYYKTINYDPRVIIYDPRFVVSSISDATIWSVPYDRNL